MAAVAPARRDADAGRPADAAAWLDAAQREAVACGDPEVLQRREPELVALVAPGSGGAGDASWRVRVLGGFSVLADGADVTPTAGHAATLVKLLALRGVATIDEVIDVLWPDADLSVGRDRLRHLLNRIRAACGPLVERTEGALRLAPGADIDATRFEREVAAALQAPPKERAGKARAALGHFGGELLPADTGRDWATTARERVKRRHLAMLDLVADAALSGGELDEACQLLEDAIAVDPLGEERYVRLARALLAQSRPARARAVVARAIAVTRQLGVEPGEGLAEVRTEIAWLDGGGHRW